MVTVVSIDFKACPRCRGDMDLCDEHARCMVCGYRDHARPGSNAQITASDDSFRGHMTVIPYAGGYAGMNGRIIWGTVRKAWNNSAHVWLRCPFCPEGSQEFRFSAGSIDSNRGPGRESYADCPTEGHRIWVFTDGDGKLACVDRQR